MRSLNNYIYEWKATSKIVDSIKEKEYKNFVYIINIVNSKIRFFNSEWKELKKYRKNVYVNNKNVEVDEYGWSTIVYSTGKHDVFIDGLDNVTDCNKMFKSCCHIHRVPLFDTSKVKDMTNMFYNCDQLISVPLFNTENVTSMEDMFRSCWNLKEVPLFNTDKAQYMEKMFYNCPALSFETYKRWTHIYDFEKNDKRK